MNDIPSYQLTPAQVQEFRGLLEREVGRKLDETDAEVEQMARNAIDLVWTLRDIDRAVRRRMAQHEVST